ncbi:MAG TPA: STAS domain-containing protein [Thermoanaerobaculia bacterium]|nr:STAS domain-containing protein [Thermoanaerobaculia bacterium]
MEITVERRENIAIVSIAGSVDGLTSADLSAAFREELGGGRVRLIGDFAGVDYTSSAGLRALLETVKETRRRGGDLRLAAVRPEVLRVLELSGFTGILKLYADVQAAADSFPA